MTEEEKKEEEARRDLNNGPTSDSNRSCRDLLCCLLFLGFIGGCVVVTIFGFSRGNPIALTYLYDENGVPCGKTGEAAVNYPYLYLYQAVENVKSTNFTYLNRGICVSSCPTSYNNNQLNCLPTQQNPNCTPIIPLSQACISVSHDRLFSL